MKKSKGHIAFYHAGEQGQYELLARSGEVYRAHHTNAIDIKGYRIGRWECSLDFFITNVKHYASVFNIPIESTLAEANRISLKTERKRT